MKAFEQLFYLVLFIMLYKMVLTFKSVDETLMRDQFLMKAVEQCFHSVLFTMLHKAIQNFKSVDETLACDH